MQFDRRGRDPAAPDPATQITVQELLQEREITYRNLLAAYLKLQEVNRQKTVFLASAAHELKTPLAVIKGYYDLLLTGSLGRLSEKQRDILEESKESCERLVRLVSMFLNYSALESGKLVLQLARKRYARLPGRTGQALVRGVSAQRRAAGSGLRSFDSEFPVRLSEGAAGGGQPSGQRAEAHAGRGQRYAARAAAFLGAPCGGSDSRAGTPAFPVAAAEQRGSFGDRYRSGNRAGASSGNFRGFRARGPQHHRHGPGTGDRQAAGAGASREDLGGERSEWPEASSRFYCRWIRARTRFSGCGLGQKQGEVEWL